MTDYDDLQPLSYFKTYLDRMRPYSKCSDTSRNAASVTESILEVVKAKNPELADGLSRDIRSMFQKHLFREDMFLSVWRHSDFTGLEGLPDVLDKYLRDSKSEKDVIRIVSGRK